MIKSILQDFTSQIEVKIAELSKELQQSLDFAKVEQTLTGQVNQFVAQVLEQILNEVLSEPEILSVLRELGGKKAMRFKEYREVAVRLGNGQIIKVCSPYFLKATPKRGPKKQGPNGRGNHLGLEVLGFIGRCSVNLVSEVVESALLCPSFDIAESVLKRRGIAIDLKTIRRLCSELGKRGIEFRGEISLEGSEDLAGQTLVIGIDGGRVRERTNKRGRKKQGQKRQGFYTPWREPKLFTLYLQDEQGRIIREFAPLHDATMGDHKELFALLKKYLKALDLSKVSRIVFCGDGSEWIWLGIQALLSELDLEPSQIYQVLDYTHAKQNLQEIIDLVSEKDTKQHKIDQKWKELLWNGDIMGLRREISGILNHKKKKAGLKKWKNYFETNQKRMQYARFKKEGLPCGSGCVESAIRRVINLRLKAPGSFWKREMAEYFLFLRSQLLSGRWDIFIKNVSALKRHELDQGVNDERKKLDQGVNDEISDSSQHWSEAA